MNRVLEVYFALKNSQVINIINAYIQIIKFDFFRFFASEAGKEVKRVA